MAVPVVVAANISEVEESEEDAALAPIPSNNNKSASSPPARVVSDVFGFGSNGHGEQLNISTLSPEIMLHIFSFLPVKSILACGGVNKNWLDLSRDRVLWANIPAVKLRRRIRGDELTAFGKALPTVRTLDLTACINVDDDRFVDLMRTLTNLKRLVLNHTANVTDEGFTAAADSLSRLESLSISNQQEISNHALDVALGTFPNLAELSLFNMRYATEEAFRGGGINTRLRSLTIRRCRGMGLVADVLAEQFPALEQLTLDTANAFTSDSFELLASGCRQLASLTVGTCDDFTDSSLMAVCEFCPNLTALAILDAPSLTEGALVDNVALRGNLRALDLSSLAAVGDALLADLGASAPNLTSLSLSSCAGVSASGVSALGGCVALKSLDLSGTRSIASSDELTALSTLTGLTDLNLSYAFAEDASNLAAGFDALCRAVADSLCLLRVSGVEIMSPCVSAMAQCTRLTHLEVAEAPFVSAEAFSELHACARLEALRISDMQLTPASIKRVVAACPGLRELSFISVQGLVGLPSFISETCAHLTSLTLLYTEAEARDAAVELFGDRDDVLLVCLNKEEAVTPPAQYM